MSQKAESPAWRHQVAQRHKLNLTDSFCYYLLLTHISKKVWKLRIREAVYYWDDFYKASPSIIYILVIDIFHKLCDIFKLPKCIDFKIWGNMDKVSFFPSLVSKLLQVTVVWCNLRAEFQQFNSQANPFTLMLLKQKHGVAVVGAARYYHLFGMASFSDRSNRVPTSGISVEQAEESANGLKGNKPETRRGPGYFRWKVLRRLLVRMAYVQEKSLFMQFPLKY